MVFRIASPFARVGRYRPKACDCHFQHYQFRHCTGRHKKV